MKNTPPWCDEDDGRLRFCCDTRQLGEHRDDCPADVRFRDAMWDHEIMYRHIYEVHGVRHDQVRPAVEVHDHGADPGGDGHGGDRSGERPMGLGAPGLRNADDVDEQA